LDHIITPRLQLLDSKRFDVCCKESKEVARKMAMLLWVIWHNRNNYVYSEIKISARQVKMQAESMWKE
jgi:hypothetical protein